MIENTMDPKIQEWCKLVRQWLSGSQQAELEDEALHGLSQSIKASISDFIKKNGVSTASIDRLVDESILLAVIDYAERQSWKSQKKVNKDLVKYLGKIIEDSAENGGMAEKVIALRNSLSIRS
jgi:hypothetical protein